MKAIFDLTVEIDDSNVGSTFSIREGAEFLSAKVVSNVYAAATVFRQLILTSIRGQPNERP